MTIESIQLTGFRNLCPVRLELSPSLNLFTGENAAGKTSLLEALFVLSRGRSFRSRHLDKLIQHDSDAFQLLARLHATTRTIPVGMQRKQGRLLCRIDGQPVKRLSELAVLLPVQWVGGNLHALIEDGPATRRQMLDWGLFHVKPEYMGVWQRYQNLLKQRNAALRLRQPLRAIQVWDRELAESAELLYTLRENYLEGLHPLVERFAKQFPALNLPLKIVYKPGWARGETFMEALASGLESDRDQGFTQIGPQRAEIALVYGDKPARDSLSRGQQKLLVMVLLLAQSTLLYKETATKSLFLLDDLGAELDTRNQESVMNLLNSIEAQVFVTAINDHAGTAVYGAARRFHVKHGQVTEVI